MDVVTRPDLPTGVLREQPFSSVSECRSELAEIASRAKAIYPEGTMAPGIIVSEPDNLQLAGNFEDLRTRYRSYECHGNVLHLSEQFHTPHIQPPPPPPPPPPPAPPGFGEPLDAGPYVFFVDHRGDWEAIIGRVKYVVERLPELTWQLCYVQSANPSTRRAGQAEATAELKGLLHEAGVTDSRVVQSIYCSYQPHDLDGLRLVAVSGEGG